MQRLAAWALAVILTTSTWPAAAGPTSQPQSPPAPGRLPMVAKGTPLLVEEAGLRMTVPERWKVEKDGDGYTISTADQTGAMVFRVCEAHTWKRVLDSLKASQARKLGHVEETGRETDTVGGMEVIGVHGTATLGDEPAWWSIDVIKARKPVVAYTLLTSKAAWQHKRGYNSLMRSLAKLP